MESSYLKKNWLFVAEIKNVPLRAEHLTQVCRYAADIDTVCEYFEVNYGIPLHLGETKKVIIFPDSNFDSKLQYEADALGIILHSFNVQLNLSLTGQWGWNGKRKGEIAQSYDSLSKLLGDRLPLIANQPIPSPPDFEEEE